MKNIIYFLTGLATLSFWSVQSSAQTRELAGSGELLDGVAAIVDDGVVLKSELTVIVAVVMDNMRLAQLELPLEDRRSLSSLLIFEE